MQNDCLQLCQNVSKTFNFSIYYLCLCTNRQWIIVLHTNSTMTQPMKWAETRRNVNWIFPWENFEIVKLSDKPISNRSHSSGHNSLNRCALRAGRTHRIRSTMSQTIQFLSSSLSASISIQFSHDVLNKLASWAQRWWRPHYIQPNAMCSCEPVESTFNDVNISLTSSITMTERK